MSSAVLCHGGYPVRLSKDHKPLEENERIIQMGGYVTIGESPRVNGNKKNLNPRFD